MGRNWEWIWAPTAGDAAVAMADRLDRRGQLVIESGSETTAMVRKHGEQAVVQITLTAVDLTQYHATQVRQVSP